MDFANSSAGLYVGAFGARWYAVALGMPVAICLIASAITFCCLPHTQVAPLSFEKIREVPERFLFILLFIGLGEEPGWRGFAPPELQTKHSPLNASLILAPLWAIWHLPLIGNEFQWPIVAPFLLSVFGATFPLTWIFNKTKGSVLLANVDARHGQLCWRRADDSAFFGRGARCLVVDLQRTLAVHWPLPAPLSCKQRCPSRGRADNERRLTLGAFSVRRASAKEVTMHESHSRINEFTAQGKSFLCMDLSQPTRGEKR